MQKEAEKTRQETVSCWNLSMKDTCRAIGPLMEVTLFVNPLFRVVVHFERTLHCEILKCAHNVSHDNSLPLLQHDYQTYISRKADKRQSLIVSLSDHYHQQLKTIEREKEELIRDYDEKKTG